MLHPFSKPDDYRLEFGLPAGWEPSDKLSHIQKNVVSGWLTDLLGVERRDGLRTALLAYLPDDETPSVPLSEADQKLYDCVLPFLLYATWANYVQLANVHITEAGLVTHTDNHSEPITSQQRAELYRYYRDIAERKAGDVLACRQPDVCERPRRVGSRIGKAVGKKQSMFDVDQTITVRHQR
ncbi:hypothetical protein DYU11_22560 [Fibrisoma montanum]|uniref:Uncharacterized protein n=1 Tax=Fibrisoma montanum TaxID=2305895 RepID=A0A418M227_9BACT|nr:hypothetical protein [Fibrisoma montanum]RIV19714.1 hypothetical protein DYU11_22560 [Fibrisoma montanum]